MTSRMSTPRNSRSVDFETREIHVRFQLSRAQRGKPARRLALKTAGSRRDVMMGERLVAFLNAHRQQALMKGQHRPGGYVFCTMAGGPFGRRYVAQAITIASQRAGLQPDGVQPLGAHDLRHTHISHLIRAGADVLTVSRQAGHSKPSITFDRYSYEFARLQSGEALRERLATAFGVARSFPRLVFHRLQESPLRAFP